jgi:dihydrolipoamide dehydrogenase
MIVGELADSVDLLVLGGGPGGYVAALRAAQLGRTVTLIERGGPDGLGGVCLQAGCIPSKSLVELARAVAQTRELEPIGLSVQGVEISLERFQARRRELCARLARGIGRLLRAAGVNVVHGSARFNRPDRVAVRTPQDAAIFFEFEHAIIATGSRSIELPGLPYDGDRVLDPSAALDLSGVPARAVVIGAEYIGLELATALAKLGACVTLVEARERILASLDPSLSASVLRRLRALGVELRCNSIAERLEGEELIVSRDGQEQRVAADRIIVAAGRVPNTDDLGLDAAGVAVQADGLIEVGLDMRVDDHIAAIGDVVYGPRLAHKATAQAVVAAEAVSGRRRAYEPAAVPIVIFSDPEIATVGLSEAQAREQGMDARTASFPAAASGAAAILGAGEGFVRLVSDVGTDRLVGVQIVGPRATELAAGAALAIEMTASAADLAGTLHPHPTISEGMHEAAEMLLGTPIHVAPPAANLASDVRLTRP